MKVLIFDTKAQAIGRVVEVISRQLRDKGDSVLGLATGGTMEPVYAGLIVAFAEGRVRFSDATTFNLDEYVGLSPTHPQSYRDFMQKNLFDQLNIEHSRTHVPDGRALDFAAYCRHYEQLIKAAGGIDLQLLGIGNNGHIGFNEPGKAFTYSTSLTTLAQSTIDANKRFFDSIDQVPRQALSMGIGTIMEAREIMLLALGSDKKDAIHGLVKGPVTPWLPASILRFHQHVTLLLDEAAAARI